jgi:para-nitrobenzyl esterase
MRKALLSALLRTVLLLSLGAAATARAAAPDEAVVSGGALKGVVLGQVVAFKNIPFAAPPVGELRWRPPQPAAPWSGVRDASAFGPSCIQSGGLFGGGPNQSEDCLSLNVWTPARRAGARLPVMVWIHGGGFIGGSGAQPYYDGAAFARDGVVLVTLNYRLGRFGFFAHPALAGDHPEEPHGNYGLMDQIAALSWVKANIAAFGGDPANVTVFGESAGAISVNFLMISPAARGLFAKAVSESGFGRFDAPKIATFAAAEAAYAKGLGVGGEDAAAAAALRALPASALIGDIRGLTDPGIPRPMIDGVVVKERVDTAFAAGRQAKVPYLVGGNSFEASLFAKAIAADPERTLAPFGGAQPDVVALFGAGDPLKAAYNVSTETLISEPDRDLAAKDAQAGVRAYLYYFSYVPAAQRATAPGAGHGSEIGYVFETLPTKPITLGARQIAAATSEDLDMAAQIHGAWVAFAKTGIPTLPRGPAWPAYAPRTDLLMEFGADGAAVRAKFLKARLDRIEAVLAQPSAPRPGG